MSGSDDDINWKPVEKDNISFSMNVATCIKLNTYKTTILLYCYSILHTANRKRIITVDGFKFTKKIIGRDDTSATASHSTATTNSSGAFSSPMASTPTLEALVTAHCSN